MTSRSRIMLGYAGLLPALKFLDYRTQRGGILRAEIVFHYIEECCKLVGCKALTQTYGHMSRRHRLHAAHSCDNRHCGQLAVLPREDVAVEYVGEKMFLQKFFNHRGKHGIPRSRSVGRNT